MNPKRHVKEQVQAAGLCLVDLEVRRAGHAKALVQRADGETALFVFAASPSDHRAAQNNIARLRRFAAGLFNPKTERTKP